MSSSEICGVVNALTRTVFDLQLNSQNFSKDLCIFNTDFYKNRRLILFSFLTYDYITTECVKITCDELDIMREFLLTYIEKFQCTGNIGTVFISYVNKRLRFCFCYYERASKTSETCDTLKLIEEEINTVFDGSIFKLLQPFFNNIPPNTPISNIKNLHLYFKEGYYYLKCNVNGLLNYCELEKTVLDWKSNNEIPIHGNNGSFISGSYYDTNIYPNGCNHPAEPAEPFAPFEPYAPSEPYCPPKTKEQKRVLEDIENTDYFNIVNKKLDKKELSKNTLSGVESAEKHEGNIRAAISRILEISSTDELTSL
jgi:hypothetical protein